MWEKRKKDMRKIAKKYYAPPEIVQAMDIRLERNLLNSVIENVQYVETAGQEIDDVIDGSSTATFNYDWGDAPAE